MQPYLSKVSGISDIDKNFENDVRTLGIILPNFENSQEIQPQNPLLDFRIINESRMIMPTRTLENAKAVFAIL